MDNWKSLLFEEYKIKFRCKNIGQVCWCETCCNIERLIDATILKVKENIK
jgi:hypothetical protein